MGSNFRTLIDMCRGCPASTLMNQSDVEDEEPTANVMPEDVGVLENTVNGNDGLGAATNSCAVKETPDSRAFERRLEEEIKAIDRYIVTGKGLVAIINNFVDTQEALAMNEEHPRRGTLKDEERIDKVFTIEKLSKYYELYDRSENNRDLGRAAMYSYLVRLRDHLEKNKEKYGCLILFIMSHGNEEGICPYFPHGGKAEAAIPVSEIMEIFEAVLPDSPKILLIQACKGSKDNYQAQGDNVQQRGTEEVKEDCDFVKRIPPPKGADMLVAYSTIPGHRSYRIPVSGCPFIQILLDQIEKYLMSEDPLIPKHLIDFIERMQYDVSQMTFNIKDGKTKKVKTARQMADYKSTLLRKFYLIPLTVDSV